MDSTFAVQAAGNTRNLQVTYDRVAMEVNGGGLQLAYDSQGPSTQRSPLAMMGSLIGKPFTGTGRGDQRVRHYEGYD
ncbi:MAG: hypothetical protein H7Z75_00220 [Ferruginibacter sp.]|nr:hypothetical protein [Cytophagales bacterium]